MNSTLAIAQRELTEKRFVFVAATAFLALALVIPFMPGVHPGERAAALVIGSMGLSAIFTLGLAAILGSSIIGRDLSDGRLSFYFSKPVPATSIWYGKLIAAAVLLAACYLIVGFPALIVGVAAPKDAVQILAAVPAVAAGLFLLTHVVGTFVRSRSAWFLFDFIAVSIFATAIWMLARPLLDGLALELLWRLGKIAAVFVGLAILAAGAWQIARGRTDRVRSHMELSRFLWASLGCGLLVIAAYVAWVVSATPRDLAVPDYANQSVTGWTFLGGRARNRMDYNTNFLYNIDSGRFLRLAKMQSWWPAVFSNDGKSAVWVVPSKTGDEVWFAQLDSPDPRPIQTRFRLTQWHSFTISPDGSRIVTIDKQGILTVDDLRSGNSLGSVRIPDGGRSNSTFAGPDLIRIYAFGDSGTSIFEYDVKRKTITPTGTTPKGYPRFNADRTQMLMQSAGELQVRDPRSGALLQTMPGSFYTAKFLRDGRIAAITRDQKVLEIFSAGAPVSVPFKGAGQSIYEVPGGPVVACVTGGCMVVDSASGTVLRTEAGIHPLSYYNTSPHLLSFWHGELVVWNPATGEKRPLI